MRALSWLYSLGVASASQQLLPGPASQPVAPSQDPWYSAPIGFEAATPGTILRVRQAPGNLTTVISSATSAYNILYRTTDSRYKPSWAVTTLFIPSTFYTAPSGNKALISYQFAYDSAALDSSPSYGLYYDLSQPVPSLGVPAGSDLLDSLLTEGWLVNTPDYEGPTAAFGASIQAGHATLDSLRAVLNLAELSGLGKIALGMWGYSGGSIATEAAAELQVQYAPELNISGAVLGGLVADFSTDFDLFNGSAIAGDLVSVVLGVTSQYPEAKAYVESRLVNSTAAEFLGARNMTLGQTTKYFSMKDIYAYFVGGAVDLQAAVLRKVYNVEMKLGYHGVPAMPMFVYKAIGDEYCPVEETDALVNKYCGVGSDITYQRNTVGGHVAEIINGQPRAIDWLRGIFNETYTPNAFGCLTRDVTVNLTSLAT
ncbi:LIP-domain-containing protein [Annulohypoxylon maeteangense]|uniref:LIP-domain-containing protein n=1 Tax=Annulohypoxylon maeteangense TaxID=1927788 RepID=UPI0020076507|nr:LIP-domain-containing protein [Annulohypoxylon maeteangense]KAI0885862.1 LIP-domain-containing protein [Annulohypoxylon maeteangense]